MKINWNKKYTSISIHVIFVIFVLFTIYYILSSNSFSNIFLSLLRSLESIVFGIVLFYLIKPAFEFIDGKIFGFIGKKKSYLLQRLVSFFVIFIILLGFILVNLIFTLPNVLLNISDATDNMQEYVSNFSNTVNNHESQYFPTLYPQVAKVMVEVSNWVISILQKILPQLEDMVTILLNVSMVITFGFVFCCIYMYRYEDREAEFKYIAHTIFKDKAYNKIAYIVDKTDKNCIKFYRGNILNSIVVSILVFLFLYIFKISYSPLIAIIVFLSMLVPIFGQILSYIISNTIVFVLNWKVGIGYSIFLIVVLVLDYIFLYKKLVGKLGLPSSWILMAAIILLGFLNIPGLLFGVPIFAVIYTIVKDKIDKVIQNRKLKTDPPIEENTEENIEKDNS